MRRLGLLICLLVSLTGTCALAAVDAVKWTLPPPESIVTANPLTVKGFLAKAPGPDERILVRRTGSAQAVGQFPITVSEGHFFTSSVNLVAGENHIIFAGKILKVYYQPDTSRVKPKDFNEYTLHKGVEKCRSCHGVWNGELTLNDEFPGLCTSCHTKTFSPDLRTIKQNKHSAGVTPYCISCHNPHWAKKAKLLKNEGETCFRCHDKLRGKVGHETNGSEPCLTCHEAHQSLYSSLLKYPPQNPCMDCHKKSVTQSNDAPILHSPVTPESCLKCHSSHSKGSPKLLKAPEKEFCKECHPAITTGGHAVDIGSCSVCHLPHVATTVSLVKAATGVCLGCHKVKDYSQSVHKDMNGLGCVACHDPHRQVNLKSAQATCFPCHTPSSEGFTYSHGNIEPSQVGQCSLCHDPHADKQKRAILRGDLHYPAKGGGCKVCHVDEAGEITLKYGGFESCTRCHGNTVGLSISVDQAKIHAPITQQDCIACHDPHIILRKGMLHEELDKTCDFCHGAIIRMGKVKHGVFVDGNCKTCHEPHFSENRPLLAHPQPSLCFECHRDILPKNLAGDEMLHGAIRDGRCTKCHSPHASDDPKLIHEDRGQACVDCHPKALLDAYGKPYKNLHGPVGAGQCEACHTLSHRHKDSPKDMFLKASPPEKICRDCHDTQDSHIPERDRASMGRIKNGCLGCHNPHGAGNALMLKSTL